MEIAAESPFIEFERTSRRRLGELNLTPLIDVLFILIIFFMLTTSFMRTESLELVLPSAAGKAADRAGVVHLFIYANGEMALDRRRIHQDELMDALGRLFSNDAATKVMLLTAEGVTMQQLVGVMDRVHMAGGKSLFVRKWDNAPPAARQPAAPKVEAPAAPVVLATSPELPPVSKLAKPRGAGGRKADIRDLYGE